MIETILPYILPPNVKEELMELAADSDLLLLGETHGTQEVPRLALGLLDDLAALGYGGLGLEMPRGEQDALEKWAAGEGEPPPFFRAKEFQDGRGNRQVLSLIRQTASRSPGWQLLCFDTDFMREGETGADRDRQMAEGLLSQRQERCAGRKVVAICGNYHSRLIAPEQPDFGSWPSLGANIQFLRPDLVVSSVNICFHGGEFYNGEVREFRSGSSLVADAELRPGGWLGHTADLHLPHAVPATFL